MSTPWLHNYVPLGNLWLSALLAALPFLLLCWLLAALRVRGPLASLAACLTACALAAGAWGMPLPLLGASAAYGLAFSLLPIIWVVLPAMWLYSMTVESGQFEMVRHSISALTPDRRLQTVFIAFAFGSLLESTAGYGTPVAIGAAMLIGLGFRPLRAATLCLVANTVPVAFAALGLPILVAGQMSDLDPFQIGRVVGSQVPILAAILPFWLCAMVSGWRKSLEVWPALLAGGLGSAVPTFFLARYHGPILPGLLSSVGSLVCLALVCRFWKPASLFRFADDAPLAAAQNTKLPGRAVLRAWLPWALLAGLAVVLSAGPVRAFLAELNPAPLSWPGLDGLVWKSAPLASPPEAMRAVYNLNIFTTPGTLVFLTALLAPLLMPGYGYRRAWRALLGVCRQMRFSFLMIALILILAQVMNYSGMSYTLGLALTSSGWFFIILAPVLGWIGVFSTGSDTSSNALFSGMQRAAAETIGLDPYLAVAANTTGGVAAKMISPQSIAVAVGATGLAGQEGLLLRGAIKHSLLMLALVCLITWLQYYV